MRRLWIITVGAVLLVTVSPVWAGGSWFEPIETAIEPGDTVTIVGFSGFGPQGDPGVTAEDAFFGYLEVDRSQRTGGYPDVHAGVVPIGQFTTTDTGLGGWQQYRLHLRFDVPADLEPGVYNVVHCNDPCTTTFGELLGGVLQVGNPSEAVIRADAELPDDYDFGQWAPVQASLDDPLVAELAEVGTLARTGPTSTAMLVMVGTFLCLAGVAICRWVKSDVATGSGGLHGA